MSDFPELLYAVSDGDIKRCQDLISSGADVNALTPHGAPLNVAASDNKHEICRLLLSAGADISSRDVCDYTPLMLAARQGHTDMCTLLISAGAAPEQSSAEGDTAFSLAGSFRHGSDVEVVRAMLEAAGDVGAKRSAQLVKAVSDALLQYAMRGNASVCELLLGAGADINLVDERGWSPLLLAAANDRVDVCSLLVRNGADPSFAGMCGGSRPLSPFQVAVQSGATHVVAHFLEHHGEDPAQRTEGGRTMMQLAKSYQPVKDLLNAAKMATSIGNTIDSTRATIPTTQGKIGIAL